MLILLDPHCCCAELSFEAPIEVLFKDNYLYDANKNTWTGFYTEDEIQKIDDSNNANSNNANSNTNASS